MARLLSNTGKGVGGVPATVLGVLALTAAGAYAMHVAATGHHRPFALRASPSRSTVTAGSAAHYRITIRRTRAHGRLFAGRVKLRVKGLPRYARSRITFSKRSRSRATLIVTTSTQTPGGNYSMRLRGSSGRFTATIRLKLKVSQPQTVSLGIEGTVDGLQPGAPQALDLSLSNPSGSSVSVTGITVTVQGVSAPRSTASLPCSPADFHVQQFSGAYPVTLPPSSTRSLQSLGIAPADQPQVMLFDRPVNQNGCQGATLTLAYDGTAVG